MAWQSLLGSQETGTGKSRVRVLQIGEVHGVGVYDEERSGLKMEFKFGSFLHWSQESSLPVSRTMVTLCGGEPTVSETVKVTLCWKESLREEEEEGLVGTETEPCGSVWSFKGNMRGVCGEDEREAEEALVWT